MSQENVEIVRQVCAIWAEGNFRTPEVFHPDVEVRWVTPDARVTHGIDALGKAWWEWLAPWEHLTLQAEELIEAGDRVVVLLMMRGRGKGSGIDTEWHTGHIWTMRNGKVIRVEAFEDRTAALKAAGLSE